MTRIRIMHTHTLLCEKRTFNSNFAHTFWWTKWIFILLETFLFVLYYFVQHRYFYFITLYRLRTDLFPFCTYYYILYILYFVIVSICRRTNSRVLHKDSSYEQIALRKLNSCHAKRGDGRIANKLRSISIIQRAKVDDRAW